MPFACYSQKHILYICINVQHINILQKSINPNEEKNYQCDIIKIFRTLKQITQKRSGKSRYTIYPNEDANDLQKRSGFIPKGAVSMKYITFDKKSIAKGKSDCIHIDNIKSFLALYNCNVHWIVPKVGSNCGDIPEHTQFLLYQKNDGSYCAVLPLIDGDLKVAVCGCDDGIYITIQGAVQGEEPENAKLLYFEDGNDPYDLTLSAVRHVCERLGSFRLRTDKNIPEFLDYIGWCTWDAFYGGVDEDKVIMGLESFKKAGFPLGFMILDDGIWNSNNEYLNTASVSESKFPNGLHSLISKAKNDYGLKMFGVWHCFTAYWCGINPDGELAKKYSYIKSYADIGPWIEEDTSQDIFMISPDDIESFYEELHSYLYHEGADMLKIDGQSSLDLFTSGKIGQGTAMKKYQQGMQKSAEKYFNSRVIHCMSNSIDVAYNMMTTNCWRNSYDYAPKDMKMQKEHIYINAMNAVWTSTFTVPDWDMFQSHSTGAEIHAASRAISGGPVYVCDYPEKQNFDILNALVISGGKVLRCEQPALPTADCLFTDCRYDKKLLKIYNTNCGEKIGIIGIFNCNVNNESIDDSYSPSDVKNINGTDFAVYSFCSKKLIKSPRSAIINIRLDSDGYDIITVSPIENGIAPLGLTDKYNSSAAVKVSEWKGKKYHAEIIDGGTISFYCEYAPKSVLCCGENADYSYDKNNCLLSVLSNKIGKNIIEITL